VGLVVAVLLAPCTWGDVPRAGPREEPPVAEVPMAPGDSLQELAERLYGTSRMAPLLVRAGWPAQPEAGTRIEVPLARILPLPRGASLSGVAARRCGSKERWPVLAMLSGIDRPHAIAAGTPVVLPARLQVRVRPGDSFGRLAYLAWGETRGAALLARWNGLDVNEPLRIGQRLEIPLGGPLTERSAQRGGALSRAGGSPQP
jgi:hypothetical protein